MAQSNVVAAGGEAGGSVQGAVTSSRHVGRRGQLRHPAAPSGRAIRPRPSRRLIAPAARVKECINMTRTRTAMVGVGAKGGASTKRGGGSAKKTRVWEAGPRRRFASTLFLTPCALCAGSACLSNTHTNMLARHGRQRAANALAAALRTTAAGGGVRDPTALAAAVAGGAHSAGWTVPPLSRGFAASSSIRGVGDGDGIFELDSGAVAAADGPTSTLDTAASALGELGAAGWDVHGWAR